ncbi:EAL domain-containing protein [Alicyclobacillus herbarius]|uniref:EAL domain-containing protein n=1 Tax=Alicyclobacillus herbarius TaxID=122960 RepID=UPI000406F70D|nr:EAL domain-containing protein [Alicyclobacillus herbarius]
MHLSTAFVSSMIREVTAEHIQQILAEGTLFSYYQPIINHQGSYVFAHEALSRPWLNTPSVMMAPDCWFYTAYKCGRSLEADLLAIQSALKHRVCPGDVRTGGYLFVNVLPTTLAEPCFLVELESLLLTYDQSPNGLVFEVTENIAYDTKRLAEQLKPLRSWGIHIALDDVGAGYADLRAMVDLEPDFIKLDRSLVQGVATSRNRQRLLESFVQFMTSGTAVIVEGIETLDDLLAAQEAGVHLSQGYYWAPPFPDEVLKKLFERVEGVREPPTRLGQEREEQVDDMTVPVESQHWDRLLVLYQRAMCRL